MSSGSAYAGGLPHAGPVYADVWQAAGQVLCHTKTYIPRRSNLHYHTTHNPTMEQMYRMTAGADLDPYSLALGTERES